MSAHSLPASGQRLADHFERVVVLSLPAAKARRERVRRHLAESGLGGAEVQYIPALPGTDTQPPRGWQGVPAWGCLRSHLTVLRQAEQDKVASILILEDDVLFDPRTSVELGPWLRRVPPDWGQIYLGGQHLQPPRRTALADVLQARNVNRAHACALCGRILPKVLRHLTSWSDYNASRLWHVDHQYGLAHERGLWAAYTPAWWFAGQEADTSQINGDPQPRRWWHAGKHALDVPFIHLAPGDTLAPSDAQTILELPWPGQRECDFTDPLLLLRQLEKVASDALMRGGLPAWRDARPPFELVGRLWPAGARRYSPGCGAMLTATLFLS
jgi:hypothetical protein